MRCWPYLLYTLLHRGVFHHNTHANQFQQSYVNMSPALKQPLKQLLGISVENVQRKKKKTYILCTRVSWRFIETNCRLTCRSRISGRGGSPGCFTAPRCCRSRWLITSGCIVEDCIGFNWFSSFFLWKPTTLSNLQTIGWKSTSFVANDMFVIF